jgi:hypothetical protein
MKSAARWASASNAGASAPYDALCDPSVKTNANIELAFSAYERQLSRVSDYIGTITPALAENRGAVPVFVESMMVVMVARFEHFLTSLIAGGVRQRESVVRDYFSQHGNPDERRISETCDLRTLIRMARRRLSFKKQGAGIERLFGLLFGFSPWHSEDGFRTISDLILVRNVFVHEGDTVLGEHATQAHRPDLFASRTYGEFTVYSVNYETGLRFLRDAISALKDQSEYVRREIESSSQVALGEIQPRLDRRERPCARAC